MRILNRQKLEELLADCEGANLSEKLRDFCNRNSSRDPAASPSFDKLILASSGLIGWIYGENQILVNLLREAEQGGTQTSYA